MWAGMQQTLALAEATAVAWPGYQASTQRCRWLCQRCCTLRRASSCYTADDQGTVRHIPRTTRVFHDKGTRAFSSGGLEPVRRRCAAQTACCAEGAVQCFGGGPFGRGTGGDLRISATEKQRFRQAWLLGRKPWRSLESFCPPTSALLKKHSCPVLSCFWTAAVPRLGSDAQACTSRCKAMESGPAAAQVLLYTYPQSSVYPPQHDEPCML